MLELLELAGAMAPQPLAMSLRPVSPIALRRPAEPSVLPSPTHSPLEQQLADYLGLAHLTACPTLPDALATCLDLLELQPGDEVILPALGARYALAALQARDLTPVLADVDADTFHPTVQSVRFCLSERTRAILVVDLFGQCADLAPLRQLADRHGLTLIEDASQSLGALYTTPERDVRKAGSLGHLVCFSLTAFEPLCGPLHGAFIGTDDARRAAALAARNTPCFSYPPTLLTLAAQRFRPLDQYHLLRLLAAVQYDERLLEVPGITTPVTAPFSTHVFSAYPIRISRNRRDSLADHLKAHGLRVTVPDADSLLTDPTLQPKACPSAQTALRQLLLLPLDPQAGETLAETLYDLAESCLADTDY